VPGAVRGDRDPGAAARHAALQQAARGRVVDGRVRRSGQAGGVGVHPHLLALPPVRPGEGLPADAAAHLHPRRPRPSGPRPQDDGQDARGRQGRALLREHRRRTRRRGGQPPGRAHGCAVPDLPLAAARQQVSRATRPAHAGRAQNHCRTPPMRTAFLLATTILMTLSSLPAIAAAPTPPDVEKRPHVVRAPHGAERQDEYYWLRDDKREDPAMLAYLQAENAYADQVLASLKPVQEQLYSEIVGRIKQDDSSIPVRERGWWYYARYETGKDYPIHARRKDGPGVDALSIQQANERGDFAGEEVLLDVNALAEGKDYYSVGAYEVSQDNRVLAWADDTNGRRQYTFRFRDLATGKAYPEEIRGTSGDLVFADDNRTVFYVENDPETLLTKRVKRHVIGTDPKDDAVVYEEADDSFYMGVDRTRDDRYIVIGVSSTVSDELRYAPAADPREFTVLAARERELEYSADHLGDRWVILTNADGAKNFKLVQAPSGTGSRGEWQDVVAHDGDVLLETFELFDGCIAIGERSDARERVRILRQDGSAQYVQADEPAYSMGLSANTESNTTRLRYTYTSLTTPATTYELDTATGERTLLKQQPVIGYDPSQYVTERVWATARDGEKIAVSLVYR